MNKESSQSHDIVPAWFADTPNNPAPTPPATPKKSYKKIWLIGGTVVILAIIGVSAALLFGHTSNCLDENDFSTLTGYVPVEPFVPVDDFYTDYILFADNSTSVYDSTSDDGRHGDKLLSSIANFYTGHPNKPMTVTISGDYFESNNGALTDARIASVHSSLIVAGVHEENIILKNADYVEVDNEAEDAVTQDRVYISITASTTCK